MFDIFPFKKARFLNSPDNLESLNFLILNLEYVISYFSQKRDSKFTKGYKSPHINYNSYKNFNDLVYKFSKDTANNIENSKLNYKHLKRYVLECYELTLKCKQIIEQDKELFFKVEMYNEDEYPINKNWYELMYNTINQILISLEYYEDFLKIDNYSNINIENTNIKVSYFHPNIDIDFNQTTPEYYLNKRTELDEFYQNKNYSDNPIEAFELFKNYYAYAYFLFLVSNFLDENLNKWDKVCIEYKNKELNEFIIKTENINPTKTFKEITILLDEYKYIRLDKGYYQTHNISKHNQEIECKNVYSLYFLFYSLLVDKLQQINECELLTKEKLQYYGFDEIQIERLLTWDNYECICNNNKNYFFASNIDKMIYSGNKAKEKQKPKNKIYYASFDEMFGLLNTEPILLIDKELKKTKFNLWLRDNKGWIIGNDETYLTFLTKEIWCEFLNNISTDIIENRPKLFKSFSSLQLQYLFDGLLRYKYIDTDFETFKYVFGFDIKPPNFIGIRWLIKNKQTLRFFVTELKHPDIIIADIERAVPIFFINLKNEKFTLANNDNRYTSIEKDNIEKIIKNIPTL
jgi:hypothetical protein